MLEKYLETYIDMLYKRQNLYADVTQKNLYTKKEYYELLQSVVNLFQTKEDLSLEEMREVLYKQSKIEDVIKEFIYDKKMIPGVVFSYGTKNYKETIVIGNQQEVSMENGKLISNIEEMTQDTIFDLASVTKIFTSLSILKLVKKGVLQLQDEVIRYAPEFINLKGITIFDLISFQVPLKTNKRIDKVSSKEEAEQILFTIEIDNSDNKRPYTDMGAMILKYVIEHVSGMDYYHYIEENILKPIGMNDTHVIVPNTKINRVVNTNYDVKYYKDGNFSINTSVPKGIVYDAKAQIMGQKDGNLSGHAGLFSTVPDMTLLAKNIMSKTIIDEESIYMMSKNRTGKLYTDNDSIKAIQYLGFLCYSKNPIQAESEVHHALSGASFASSGWTGNQLTIDPINQLYVVASGNRSHNRMTYIDPVHKNKVQETKTGKKMITLPNGEIKIDATRFAWDRDAAIIHPSIKLAVQYKMLEDIFQLMHESIRLDEKVRVIK